MLTHAYCWHCLFTEYPLVHGHVGVHLSIDSYGAHRDLGEAGICLQLVLVKVVWGELHWCAGFGLGEHARVSHCADGNIQEPFNETKFS